ncbi:MAG TPA: Smr/MutS family protein [Burkholderiales bacterium]|nr:Smr/MutS family protein [Burkholderiales bacterium]
MAKHSKTPEPPDDADLLREALKDVAPIRQSGRVVHDKARRKPVPTQRLKDERQALAESLSEQIPLELALESGEELVFVRDGLGSQILRKLRRGHWVVQDHLDLHGLRSEEARVMLVEFLNESLQRGYRCVRVVHGKGLGSRNREPVLKKKVAVWLAQRDEVLAFCQAPANEGGSGAALVLLKASPRPRFRASTDV